MNIPDFTFPPQIASLAAFLPRWPADQAILAAMNLAVRFGVLPADALDPLEARVVGFEVTDLGISSAVTCLNGRFWRAEVETAELMMRAPVAQFLQLLVRQEDPDTLFFNRTLVVEGDTELGLIAKNLLDSIDWGSIASLPFVQLFRGRPA